MKLEGCSRHILDLRQRGTSGVWVQAEAKVLAVGWKGVLFCKGSDRDMVVSEILQYKSNNVNPVRYFFSADTPLLSLHCFFSLAKTICQKWS